MSSKSYEIRPLSSDEPDCPQNVTFVEVGNTTHALKAMFKAVHDSDGAVNAAVWKDTPSKTLDAQQRQGIEEWCKQFGFSLVQKEIPRKKNFKALSRLFNKVAGKRPKGTEKLLKPFENHIRERLRALSSIFPDKRVFLTIHASILDTQSKCAPGGNPHIDKGVSSTEVRFIETIAGGATCLIDDKQVVFGAGFNKIHLKEEKTRFWQVPTGALTLLTNMKNAEKPVMHTAPPREEIVEGDVRIVVIYNLLDKRKSFLSRFSKLFP